MSVRTPFTDVMKPIQFKIGQDKLKIFKIFKNLFLFPVPREWNHFLQRFSSAPLEKKTSDEPILSLQRNVFLHKRDEVKIRLDQKKFFHLKNLAKSRFFKK